ncbi:MAG: phosphate ABC transporter permease PstA [Planctomycetota bacterium]|nr:phosphate ABC transporter permease PstA [Planctomycetota bacterium]
MADAPGTKMKRRLIKRRSSLFARGEPMVWMTGAALVVSIAMILGLLGIVLVRGGTTFWPQKLKVINLVDGRALMGELTRTEEYKPEAFVFDALPEADRAAAKKMVEDNRGRSTRYLWRTGNNSPERRTQGFTEVSDFQVKSETFPEWAVTIERSEWGRFYGEPIAFLTGEERTAEDPATAWELFEQNHDKALDMWDQASEIEKEAIGDLDAALEKERLRARSVELEHGTNSPEHVKALEARAAFESAQNPERTKLRAQVDELRAEAGKYALLMKTSYGSEEPVRLVDIIRAYPANRLDFFDKVGIYISRWWEYLTANPREANTEGGVWPAILGTIVLTMIMTILVVPFGVLGALYLREYAKQGALVSLVRIAVNNLAGVPSIVFGVFGLGFFCYTIGAGIDEIFFAEQLPNPTFGKGAILWASLTLALLTLPVVIVATEEALAAVPNSMREGSYACGASKWQTIRRIVLPRAMPGVMTGMILAIARGAGEVAPIMLVGAAKMAPDLPVDGEFPFVHPTRGFMHLGFHIYDVGFQSPNAKAAEPLVFTTTLLLIGIVIVLNVVAIWVRARLRRAYIEGG